MHGRAPRLRHGLLLASLLAPAAAGAEPTLTITWGERRMEIGTLELDLAEGEVQLEVSLATGGSLSGNGTLSEGALELAVTASEVALGPVIPWILPVGGTPLAEGVLSGKGSVRRPPRSPVEIDARVQMRDGFIDWIDTRFEAPIDAKGVVRIGNGTLLENVAVTSSEVRHWELEARSVSAVVHLRDKQLRVEAGRGRAFHADWKASARVDFRRAEPPFRVALEARSEPDGNLFEVSPEEGPSVAEFDSMEGEVRLTGRWTGDERWLDSLEGPGRVRVRGGHELGTAVLPAIWNALVGRLPVVRLARLPSFIEYPNKLIEGRMSYEVREGYAHSDDILWQTEDYVAVGKGRFGLDGSTEAKGTVDLTQKGIERMFTIAQLPLPDMGAKLGAIPFELTGTWQHPEVEASVARIPFAWIKAFFRYVLPI